MTSDVRLLKKCDVKTEAESLATLIELGFSPVVDAIRWADEVIANTPGAASGTLCDISMVGATAYPQHIVHYLRSIPGDADPTRVVLAVFCRAKDLLRESADNSRILANALRGLATETLLPIGSVHDDVWWFDDALDLSESQIIPDTQKDLAAKMIGALDIRMSELRDELSDEHERDPD